MIKLQSLELIPEEDVNLNSYDSAVREGSHHVNKLVIEKEKFEPKFIKAKFA
jgi:hypothetical protein